MQAKPDKYDNISIALHWIIGIGILLLAGMELGRGEFPRGHIIRESLRPLHQPLGTLLFALILVRIAWRLFAARIPDPAPGSPLVTLSSKLMHGALYALMLILPLLGMVFVFGTDKPIDFGLFKIALPLKSMIGDFARTSRYWHEKLGVTILILALLHAAAALVHHYIIKDGLISRMTRR